VYDEEFEEWVEADEAPAPGTHIKLERLGGGDDAPPLATAEEGALGPDEAQRLLMEARTALVHKDPSRCE